MAYNNHPIRAPSSSAGSEIAMRRGRGKPKYYLGSVLRDTSFGTLTHRPPGHQLFVLRDVNSSSSGTSTLRPPGHRLLVLWDVQTWSSGTCKPGPPGPLR